jgi:hypothetical protein
MGFYVPFLNIRVNAAMTAQTLSLGRQPNLQLLFYYFDGTDFFLLHSNNKFKQKLLGPVYRKRIKYLIRIKF